METKKSPIVTLLGGILSGMAVAFLSNRRDRRAGEPTVIDKMKSFERNVYADGQQRALTIKKIKRDTDVAVNTINEKSAIQ